MKNFCVVKFSRFCSIHEVFLTVDNCNMIWMSAWRVPGVLSTTRYQESQGLLAVSLISDIHLMECGLACKLIH